MNPVIPSLLGRFRKLSPVRRTLLTILLLFSGLLLLSWMSRPGLKPVPRPGGRAIGTNTYSQAPENQPNDADLKNQWERIKNTSKESAALRQAAPNGIVDWAGPIAQKEPCITHAAEVAVATEEFKRSRTSLEGILERHHAYAAKLRMVGEPSGSTLMATLRVPSAEFSATVDDLKTLGSVEREEQTADEITVERADVEARLRNAQNTLARLKEMLEQGWKAGNPAEIQRQLANVTAEIARLQTEKTATDHRVLFSQVLFSLREEVVPRTETFGSQFHSAVMAGFADGLSTLSGILFFVVSRGPALLLWIVLLYFPSRWLWRKWHGGSSRNVGLAPGV
jgi:hypothetical protein